MGYWFDYSLFLIKWPEYAQYVDFHNYNTHLLDLTCKYRWYGTHAPSKWDMWIHERGEFWTHCTYVNYPITLQRYPMMSAFVLSNAEVETLNELHLCMQIQEDRDEIFLPDHAIASFFELRARVIWTKYYHTSSTVIKTPLFMDNYVRLNL